MKKNMKKFARIGLIIASIGGVASLALGIILRKFSLPVQLSLLLAVLGLAAYIIMDPQSVKKILTGRQAKHGSNALILSIAIIGILVIINLVAYKNSLRWDFTEDKQNTLSQETIDILNKLETDITVKAFYSARLPTDTAKTLLDNYQSKSNGKITYEFIDPDADPIAATNAGIQRDGSLVISSSDQQEIVTTVTEQQLTSVIIRLSQPGERTVYFLTGHGERSITESSEFSYTTAVTELEAKNYTTSELNLLATNSIPDDAKAIIIADPQKPLSENEVALINAYQSAGGSLVILYEPSILTNFGNLQDPLAQYLRTNWGISINDDFIIDQTADPVTVSVAATYSTHPITNDLGNMVAVLPSARSIEKVAESEINVVTLASTTDQSWAETDLAALINNQTAYSEQSDQVGPIGLAAASADSTTQSRVVVFGDADFADDNFYTYYANADLFLNAVDWAANQDNLINLTARAITSRLLIPPQVYIQGIIMLVSIVLIPGMIILAAIIIFVRRKREI